MYLNIYLSICLLRDKKCTFMISFFCITITVNFPEDASKYDEEIQNLCITPGRRSCSIL